MLAQLSADELFDCLSKIDAKLIWNAQIEMQRTNGNGLQFPFVPTEDKDVFGSYPAQPLEYGFGKSAEILVGSSKNPGSLILKESVYAISSEGPTFVSYDKFRATMHNLFNEVSTSLGINVVLQQYKNWNNLSNGYENQKRLADAIGDFYFTCPLRKFSDLWSSRGMPTYHFVFSHPSSGHSRSNWMGVVHGDELDYFLGVPALRFPDKFTANEVQLSKDMVAMLGNFIRLG